MGEGITETFEALRERVASMSAGERQARLAEVELEVRRLEAELAVLVRSAEQDGSFTTDGHLTVGGYLRGEVRWSQQQVTARRRLGRLLDETPVVVEHLHAGVIGVAQAHAFGRRRRTRGAAASWSITSGCCCGMRGRCRSTGSTQRSARGSHSPTPTVRTVTPQRVTRIGASRSASSTGSAASRPKCGALDYEAVTKVFEQYQHAEWLADWDDAKARYGDDVAGSMLARTNSQRAWDAFMKMINDAVSAPPDSQPPEPIVNLVWSEQHAEAQMARSGLVPEPNQPPTNESTTDWRCETTSGTPVSPFEAMQALLAGRLRRVVFDSAGVVVDFGRLQRLFDGAARQAVLLQFPTCIFPGCNRPAHTCEADHIVDWRHGGTTDQRNGAPLCDRHNQLKNRGFTVWRDPHGTFHTYRPDGTEIAPAPPPPGTSPPTIPKAA